ncbi:copper fist DNA binding domain-containing protein [Aspergillus spinulosporus]
MLIDGEKWACEACVRGHRTSTCKHHDRPLIHINRKGRPFSTCSICNCTPCNSPDEHNRLRREAELKMRSEQNRGSGRHGHSHARPAPALLPIAPRPPSSSPPASTNATAVQPSSRSGYRDRRGSQYPDAAARTTTPNPRAIAATVTAGVRGAAQGVLYHRTNYHSAPTQKSGTGPGTSSMHSPPLQPYALQPGIPHHASLSPLAMPHGSFSPPQYPIPDISDSMSLVSPYDHPYGGLDASFLDPNDGAGAAVFPSLEDLGMDAVGLQDDLMQEEWRWFAEDHDHELR